MSYYVAVKPNGSNYCKTYSFESAYYLKEGTLCKCDTRYGDMFGVVCACVWCADTCKKDMEKFIKSFNSEITFPLKKVKAYYEERKIKDNDE